MHPVPHPVARRYLDALLRLDRDAACAEVDGALAGGMQAESVYLDILAASQYEVGRLWESGRISVGQEHYCTAVSQSVMARMASRIFARRACGRTLVAACVDGNMHEFGARMLADIFQLRGWDTVYLGGSLPHRDLVDTAARVRPDAIAISASLEAHVESVGRLVAMLRSHPGTSQAMILVGGGAFLGEEGLWRRTGADAHATDAVQAEALATAAAIEAVS